MFFPELMTAIHSEDRVLEIGPGSTPNSRSNAFLELSFDSNENKVAQRGGGRLATLTLKGDLFITIKAVSFRSKMTHLIMLPAHT